MAYTQTELDALDRAIAQGALSVEYGDKKVTYRSLDDMLRTRQLMRDELGLNGATPANNGRRYGSFSKGLI